MSNNELGCEFVYAVDDVLKKVTNAPTSFPIVEGSKVRRALVNKFPYAVFFEIDDNTTIIYAVFHTSRNPLIWRDRLS